MKIAVVVGAYNEEKHITDLLEALLNQTRLPDEIIIVDDGSKDRTAEIIGSYVSKNPIIKYIFQKNAGPAAARNNAWKNSTSDICIFTDGDCVPENVWVERLIKPFDNEKVGGVAGAYKTINKKNILSRFIGLEIEWRYSKVKDEIQAHGTYNLAVRKKVLEEIGGLDESYPVPSGEDWDMTYKISERYKLIFIRDAVVGHYHPEKFWWYMKNQVRRAFDRIKVYKDHPEMKKGDNYTPSYTKYQLLSSALFAPSLIFLYPLFKFSFALPIVIFLVMMITTLIPFPYLIKKDIAVAFYSIPVQIARGIAWFIGGAKGLINFGL